MTEKDAMEPVVKASGRKPVAPGETLLCPLSRQGRMVALPTTTSPLGGEETEMDGPYTLPHQFLMALIVTLLALFNPAELLPEMLVSRTVTVAPAEMPVLLTEIPVVLPVRRLLAICRLPLVMTSVEPSS